MATTCTDSDKGDDCGYDRNGEIGSEDEHDPENQSALGNINDEEGHQEDGKEISEEIGKKDEKKADETGAEADSA
ncbi:hypothetical protein MMC18_001445 [Xylographa bjoerkii]|nr:hypothetical protein [Xylographa bjoerkii]